MNSSGAQEIFVSTAHGVCDFISAMDTARLSEWNCWYHLMNCGFPLKVSGETDFPCMSGTRVGQGRVYVQLGRVARIDFAKWCEGLAQGRSYVSDGYAHALEFSVNGRTPGETVQLQQPARVNVRAKVAFSSRNATGSRVRRRHAHRRPAPRRRHRGAARDHRRESVHRRPAQSGAGRQWARGRRAAKCRRTTSRTKSTFTAEIARSSWVALRHFPQLHTNPVNVLVAGQPIRASRQSAQWCIGCIDQLWRVRGKNIVPAERDEAQRTFEAAKEIYRRIAAEAPEGS